MAERTVAELETAAKHGDAEACFLVGCGLTHGQRGFARDAASARIWLLRAAELSPAYEAEIAMWIMEGAEPFERDEALALSMLRSAAAQGQRFAQLEYALRCDDPGLARKTLVDLASRPTEVGGLEAVVHLLGQEEAKSYRQWAIHECKDAEKRRAALERRTDPDARRGLLAWRAPWL